jgi:exopolyphosphatase/guanosine-5'-triphosphate,3'-diphosphate pyrophosphatase
MDSQQPVAVINIGSVALRLTIAEYDGRGVLRLLEQAYKPIPLGREVFGERKISRSTMREAVEILRGYAELSKAYHAAKTIAVGASPLREAQNRDTFLDLLSSHSGTDIRIIDESEEIILTYLAVLQARNSITDVQLEQPTLILDVGAGTTQILFLDQGRVIVAYSVDLGSVRIVQEFGRGLNGGNSLSYFRERTENCLRALQVDPLLKRMQAIVGVGGDLRYIAQRAGIINDEPVTLVTEQQLDEGIAELLAYLKEGRSRLQEFEQEELQGLLSSLQVYKVFMENSSAKRLVLAGVGISHGILLDHWLQEQDREFQSLHEHVLSSALHLRNKVQLDRSHSDKVTFCALKLFDSLRGEFGFTEQHRLHLQVAALLHDIGKAVNPKDHQLHGRYMLEAAPLFGLRKRDSAIIGQLIRYHSGETPQSHHSGFTSLPISDQVIVSKLAAILRLAEAMDRGHKQRVSDFTVARAGLNLVLRVETRHDITVEKLIVLEKAQYFEDVFGLQLMLQ